jgi:hypothetical protein
MTKGRLSYPRRPWSKLPSWWAQDSGIRERIQGGEKRAGTSIALIRLMLWLASLTPKHDSYAVECSLGALAEAMKVSRPPLRAAIKRATSLGLIRFERGNGRRRSRFELVCPKHEAGEDGGFCAVPNQRMQNRLRRLPMRGTASLAAHKIYVTLLVHRGNPNREVTLNYINLRGYTGIQQDDIRDALNLLATHGLVVINREPSFGDHHSANVYRLRGQLPRQADPDDEGDDAEDAVIDFGELVGGR